MPRKSAKSKKAMGNKKKQVQARKCQSALLCDSRSMNQDDILLMEELAQAHKSIELQASSTDYASLDPEQHISKEGSVEDVPDCASEASTDLMGSHSDANAMNETEVLEMESISQAKGAGSTATEDSASNADSEPLISEKAEGAREASTDTKILHLDSDSSDYSDCETEDYGLCLEEGRGVNIVSVSGYDDDGQRFQLNEAALAALVARPGVADLPVVVVGVAGAFRGGKSFLMGFLLRYLYAQARGAAEDWLGAADAPLVGFTWRGGCERETTGLVLWSQPVPVTLPSGEQVAVLLLDSQGAFDSRSSLRDSSLLFALSTLLASRQLYNLSQRIAEDDLQHLQVFTEYAALGGALPALTMLVRDWSAPYEYAYGADGGAAYLRDQLMVKPEQPRELREVRARLASSFERVDCFLLPHPGLHAAQDPAFQGRLDEVGEEFKQSLRELAPRLLAPEQLRVRRAGWGVGGEGGGGALRARDLPALLRACLAELSRAGTTPRSILSASAAAAWLVGAADARAALARAAPRLAQPRGALARLLQDARDAALAPLAPLAARASQEQALADLRQELDHEIIRLTENNEMKIEMAVSRARAAFALAARELDRAGLCGPRGALAPALERARARGLRALERALAPGDLPERAQLAQELEERVARLLPRLTEVNDTNNEAALADACAALRRALPAAPCAHAADLAPAHSAARRAALGAWAARRSPPGASDSDPAESEHSAERENDEYWERLQNSIDTLLLGNKCQNIRNNKFKVSEALELYDSYVNLDRGCWPAPQLDSKNEEGRKAAMEYFYGCRAGPNGRETDDFVKDLEMKLINRYNDLCEKNRLENTDAVTAALKVFNDTMDASIQGSLQMSASVLAGKLNTAFNNGKRNFLSKRAISSIASPDDNWNLLELMMIDRFDHYRSKNDSNLTREQLAVALTGSGLVLGGAVAGGAYLAAAVAGRLGFTAVLGLGASLFRLFKK